MGTVSFTRPIDQQVNNHQGLETTLAKAFKQVFADVFEQQVQDMLDYGCPHLGSRAVIERFSKQDGLVVLRRPFTSDTLMRVIYANWSSLASERGLGFLEFVLRMLWTDQWQIKRMWHPIKTYLNYPAHITVDEKPEHFLTSRLRISIEDTVDTSEIIELSPILRRLVPANVVVKVHSKALDVELGDSSIGVGVYGRVYQVIDFSDHAAESEIVPVWGGFNVNKDVVVNTSGIAHYTAYKTNQRDYYDSYADLDLTAAIIRSLHDADMQQWQAVIDAVNELTGVTNWTFDNVNSQIVYNSKDQPIQTYQYIWLWNGVQPEQSTSQWFGSTPEQACRAIAPTYQTTLSHVSNITMTSQTSGTARCNWADGFYQYVRLHPNPLYDPTAEKQQKSISLDVVAQQVIANASSSNQAISLLAEAYLENVAKSIFAADESKQLVRMADLIEKFELNKFLRV